MLILLIGVWEKVGTKICIVLYFYKAVYLSACNGVVHDYRVWPTIPVAQCRMVHCNGYTIMTVHLLQGKKSCCII